MSNTMLLDMLGARAAAEQNTAALEMIARIRDGGAAATQPDTQALLSRLGNGNPMLAMLLQHMSQQRQGRVIDTEVAVEAEELEVEASEEQYEEPLPEPYRARAQVSGPADGARQLRARIVALTDEVRALKDREDLLADALGACCLCWGQDRQCRACRGRGSPGYAKPDEELFEDLVLPAVQMLHAWRANKPITSSGAALVEPRAATASSPHS